MARMTSLLLCSLLALGAGGAAAQPHGADEPAPVPGGPLLQQSNGVKFLNGGADEKGRDDMLAQTGEYPLHIALSGHGGDPLVAVALTLSNSAGRTIASVPDAGPLVMLNLPPGEYAADVALPGGGRARKTFRVGRDEQTLDWAFPDASR